MGGAFLDQGGMFSYLSPESRIPADHPLRQIRILVREVLKDLSRSFGRLYSREGRPSIPPEQLLSALLLQVFYGIRSERQLIEQLDYQSDRNSLPGSSRSDVQEQSGLHSCEIFSKLLEEFPVLS